MALKAEHALTRSPPVELRRNLKISCPNPCWFREAGSKVLLTGVRSSRFDQKTALKMNGDVNLRRSTEGGSIYFRLDSCRLTLGMDQRVDRVRANLLLTHCEIVLDGKKPVATGRKRTWPDLPLARLDHD